MSNKVCDEGVDVRLIRTIVRRRQREEHVKQGRKTAVVNETIGCKTREG
jgi:uncharacterized protein (UPF0335 family)